LPTGRWREAERWAGLGGETGIENRLGCPKSIKGQLAPFALRDVGDVEIAEAFAVEGFDVPTLGGEHAPHLVVFAFDEGEFGDAGSTNDQFGGGAGEFLALELKRAGGEERDEGLVQVAIDGGAVDLVDLVLGRGEAVDEFGLVGEQDRTAGVFIEPADGRDDGVTGAPASGE